LIVPIIRTSLIALKRDRGALVLSFILPLAFFTIFAVIFGGRRDSTAKVQVIVVDEDRSSASQRLIKGLEAEGSLSTNVKPPPKKGVEQPDYTAETAQLAVKAGTAPVAIIIPQGFGAHPISFGVDRSGATIQLLKDSSDMIAPQIVAGLLQKVAMTSMPDIMAEQGSKYMDLYVGGLTAEQHKRFENNLNDLRRAQSARDGAAPAGGRGTPANADNGGMLLSVVSRDVVGENKDNPMVSFYAAAIGVMFLLFTASGTSGSLLDEAESGTLDRVLSTRVTMGGLLAGKLWYGTALALAQLLVMFIWAWLVFKLDFLPHLLGFAIMGLSTAFAVSAFGMLLASICRTRAQLGPLSTLVILIMSSVGGSMFPRFLMPDAMQKAGLLTINAWAIDGFTKVFWRDEPVSHLWPQVLVLIVVGTVLFGIARRIARRLEYA
jgi:ABC-2 type transport system permease protein